LKYVPCILKYLRHIFSRMKTPPVLPLKRPTNTDGRISTPQQAQERSARLKVKAAANPVIHRTSNRFLII
jgi:hypothetical protein